MDTTPPLLARLDQIRDMLHDHHEHHVRASSDLLKTISEQKIFGPQPSYTRLPMFSESSKSIAKAVPHWLGALLLIWYVARGGDPLTAAKLLLGLVIGG